MSRLVTVESAGEWDWVRDDPYPELDQVAWRRRMLADFPKVPANESEHRHHSSSAGENSPVSRGVGDFITPVSSLGKTALRRLRLQIAKRDNYQCQRCLRDTYREKDVRSHHHIIPRDEGGPTTLENLILLCVACHDWVEIQESPIRNRAQIVGSGA